MRDGGILENGWRELGMEVCRDVGRWLEKVDDVGMLEGGWREDEGWRDFREWLEGWRDGGM